MITEVYPGNGIAKLLDYLYGPGRHDTHDDPHMVAAWDPGIIAHYDPGPNGDVEPLANLLYAPVAARGPAPKDYVWHCAVRVAEEDPSIDDATWAQVAARLVAAAGVAPAGDASGCRWVAVRHDGQAAHHIHIAATLVRQDGRLPRIRHDWLRLRHEANAIEAELGLRGTGAIDGSAAKHPTRAEHGKAERLGVALARAELAGRVRHAAAASTDDLTFFTRLRVAHGALVRERIAPSGDVTGYAVALPSYRAASTGEPIYFSGSRLAPDLSLPRLRARWAQVAPMLGTRPQLWAAAADRVHHAANTLAGSPPAQAAGVLSGLGEMLTIAGSQAPEPLREGLAAAAAAFDPATRLPRTVTPASTVLTAALASSARALHRAGRAMNRDNDLQAALQLLTAAVLATRAANRWHATHQLSTQAVAAHRTTVLLETMTDDAEAAAALGKADTRAYRPTPARSRARRPADPRRPRMPRGAYADAVSKALAGTTDPRRILADPAWPTLQRTLNRAVNEGMDINRLLADATVARELATAKSPAKVLHWRIARMLGSRQAAKPQPEQLQLL
jgi:MobA/VirD2-like, nuclease domain